LLNKTTARKLENHGLDQDQGLEIERDEEDDIHPQIQEIGSITVEITAETEREGNQADLDQTLLETEKVAEETPSLVLNPQKGGITLDQDLDHLGIDRESFLSN